MANILIPERFKNKLELNQGLDGIVKSTLYSFGDLFEESKLFFFNEYTNHGIKHIQDVLYATDNLITDNTLTDVLSDKDIGFYILSVILHDIGMHIDLDGFDVLLNGKYDDIKINEFDKLTWKELWEDFLNESHKFSGSQLKGIFGDESTIVRTPPLSKHGEITENDKKLIGEFIRRHHSRLAHEIAIKGFPAKPTILEFSKEFDLSHRNLIGLIARSHGIGLRNCLDYIEEEYGKENRRFPKGIHATYLMVLLRISDYIQIDSSRTNQTLLKIKTFSSPVSELEHNKHLSIDTINWRWNDDPEKIYVSASPQNSKMFLILKKLIKDIQYEFDISWAVLGELYGKSDNKDKAQIKYRRISSNLEDIRFVNKQNFVADSFAFKANDEVIKLLIAPLYGDNPSFGVRELLQNAIDACKEREVFETEKGNPYSSFITIRILKNEDNESYFEIIDNGIGMDTDVIKNYFLSAGASYRKSSEWQKLFVDVKGKSLVRRSGRFGVGILSAFLIGDEIEVTTKKQNHNIGYVFKANINDTQINILKNKTLSTGTTIKIKINVEKLKYFTDKVRYNEVLWYDWFTFSNPRIEYSLYKTKVKPKSSKNLLDTNNLPNDWHAIDSLGYNKIIWSYSNNYFNKDFTCNGIFIPRIDSRKLNLGLISNKPKIAVLDNNAFLPLSLSRNSLSDDLSFSVDLLNDLYKDLIAYTLVFDKCGTIVNNIINIGEQRLNHPATTQIFVSSYHNETIYGKNRYAFNDSEYVYDSNLKNFINMILISKNGYILNYNYFVNKLNSINALLIEFESLEFENIELDIKDRFIYFTDNKTNSIPDYQNAIEGKENNYTKKELYPINSRVFLKSEKHKFLFKSNIKRVSTCLNKTCKVKYEKYGFTCLHLDKPKPSIIDDVFLNENANNLHFIREYEIKCDTEGDKILNVLLDKYIGNDVVIPFLIDERKKKFPLAFKELQKYMEKYIKLD